MAILTERMLEELSNDIENDDGLHVDLIFSNWRSRNKLRVNITEVYPLINNIQMKIERAQQ